MTEATEASPRIEVICLLLDIQASRRNFGITIASRLNVSSGRTPELRLAVHVARVPKHTDPFHGVDGCIDPYPHIVK